MEDWWIYLILIIAAAWFVKFITKPRKSYHRRPIHKRIEPTIGCVSDIDVGGDTDG